MISRVYIFDAVDDNGPATMNDRVAACYAWAEQRGLTVIDEVLSWAPADSTGWRLMLDRAMTACRRDRAALLVHSHATLPTLPTPAHDAAPPSELLTVAHIS